MFLSFDDLYDLSFSETYQECLNSAARIKAHEWVAKSQGTPLELILQLKMRRKNQIKNWLLMQVNEYFSSRLGL